MKIPIITIIISILTIILLINVSIILYKLMLLALSTHKTKSNTSTKLINKKSATTNMQHTYECPYYKYNYLYKAKSITGSCKGTWVTGSYIYQRSQEEFTHRIQPPYSCSYALPVDPDTICRCTGMNDKKKNLIWENDIVKIIYNGKEYIYIVVWDSSELGFKATNGKENYENHFQYLTCCEEIKVIGNVFDNPDLLEKIS